MITRDPTARPHGRRLALTRRVLATFAPYRKRVVLLILVVTAGSALALLPLRLLGAMADRIVEGDVAALDTLFAAYVGLVVAAALASVARAWINWSIGQRMTQQLRSQLHAHVQALPLHFFTRTRTGEILSRLTTDINGVQSALNDNFTDFIGNLTLLIFAFALMFDMSWQLAAIALVVVPLWAWPTMKMGLLQRRLMREWHAEAARMSAHVEETLSVSGAMLVKSFGRDTHERGRFEQSNAALRRLMMRRILSARWFDAGNFLFSSLVPGVVYWWGGRAVADGEITIGALVAFALLTQRVFGPFAAIARVNVTILASLALFERLFEFLDERHDIADAPDAQPLPRARGDIEFDHVTFRYHPRAAPALIDVSLRVHPGEMLALVGPSGAGKTTITYLLQRFYDPQEGEVRLDGSPLPRLRLHDIAANVGAVMQDTYLFHDTLAANIRYGRLDAGLDAVRAAADSAGLTAFIDRLPSGLDTIVGERGYRLSGGEKQRVAIARAILKDAPVLVLDEATASLDSKLEREIREAMERLAHGRTTVVIAHRLSTVLRADQICVLDRGRIVETGRHPDLLARGGLYATLYHEQFAAAESPLQPTLD